MKQMAKILKFIATGSLPLILSACYGVAREINEKQEVQFSLKTENSDGEPIPNLNIQWNRGDNETTWFDGGLTNAKGELVIKTVLANNELFQVKVTDIDGKENGEYKGQTLFIDTGTHKIIMEKI